MTTVATEHVFERAGLGRAPFRFVRVERRIGPMPVPGSPGVTVGAPGQPCGTCQFCGEGIAECCVIRGADGKEFIVGNVCVGKTGDAGLRKAIAPELRVLRREAQRERDDKRINDARERVASDSSLRKRLSAEIHPYAWRRELGETALHWAEWTLTNAGTRGRLEVVRYIKKLDASTE